MVHKQPENMKNITFTSNAYSDFLDWLITDKKVFLKITKLIQETARPPNKGTGKPELLKHDYNGYWSRRIDKEHRLVYKITENSIKIVSCKYHYK